MQSKPLITRVDRTIVAEEMELKYDKIIRVLFRALEIDRPKEEKIELIQDEYKSACDENLERDGLLIKKLQKLKEEIKTSRPNLLKKFTDAVKLLLNAQIIDSATFKELTGPEDKSDHAEATFLYAVRPNSLNPAEAEKAFIKDLLKRKVATSTRDSKYKAVVKMLEQLNKIDFSELEPSLTFGFERYGSSDNGFALESSDIDISITTNEPVDERKLLDSFYHKANSRLKNMIGQDTFEIKKLTQNSIRIPIVKIYIKSNIALSFTVNNELPKQNTALLKAYAHFSGSFHVLGLLVKIWARTHKAISAQQNYLSSYGLILLALNFLQTMKNPILPSLQALSTEEKRIPIIRRVNKGREEEFQARVDFENDPSKLEELKKQYSTKYTDLDLLRKFFKFYSQPSKFENVRFSVREASHKPRQSEEEWTYLYSIEDPFDSKHNPGRYIRKDSPEAIQLLNLMKMSYKLLKENKYKEVFQPLM